MNCSDARERMVDRWMGTVDESAGAELEMHLRGCTSCRAEAESGGAVWEALGRLPMEQPGPAVRARFYEMLDAYRLGAAQAEWRRRASLLNTLRGWWPQRPAWQFAVACLFLVIGLATGRLTVDRTDEHRMAQLGEEVHQMRQLVTLSLLDQQSASERLRGVTYAYRVDSPEPEVLAALARTLNADSNVNVRLAAVDALQRFSASPEVRRQLRQSLEQQTSPLVQIALIDWMSETGDRASVEILERLDGQEDLNPVVKLRIERTLARLR